MNIAELSTIYLAEKEQRRKATTVDGYASSIRRYVLPEFGALTIEQLDPEHIQRWVDGFSLAGAVTINKSRQYVRWSVVVLPTKTRKSNRTLYLPKFALVRLREIWRSLEKPRGWCNPDNPQTIARRVRRFAARNGLPEVTMKDQRHSWATMAIEANVPIETVAICLGHSSISTAYENYIVTRKSIIKGAQRLWETLLFHRARKPRAIA